MKIEALAASRIEPYLEHLVRHLSESGRGGTPIFDPRPRDQKWDSDAKRPVILERWARSLEELGWQRAWAAWDEGRFVGHIDLRSRELPSCPHRAMLGLGIEESHRGRGLGLALMETALDWARRQPGLDWVDLHVFAHNEPALRLYRRCGFAEVGRVPDFFRIGELRVEDVQMSLKVK